MLRAFSVSVPRASHSISWFAPSIEARTAEEIVQRFTSLELPDVYQALGYYLKHRTEFAEYFEEREREERELLAGHPEWSPQGLRERLLARRKPQ